VHASKSAPRLRTIGPTGPEALARGRALDEYDLTWIEEP
jgi:hypothetical protein